MCLSARQREAYEANAELGFLADEVDKPRYATLRQLSLAGGGGRGTVRQSVGAGVRSLISWRGHPVDSDDAMEIVDRHMEASQSTPSKTSYAAAHWDDANRPLDILTLPNQVFGSHQRPPTESHDARAVRGDHRGHGVSQATTVFPPGLHRSFMTSQSPEMNVAVQLPFERLVSDLIAAGRRPIWEVHNEFGGGTPDGVLPRASHQRFIVMSVDENGDDLQLHCNVVVSQR